MPKIEQHQFKIYFIL